MHSVIHFNIGEEFNNHYNHCTEHYIRAIMRVSGAILFLWPALHRSYEDLGHHQIRVVESKGGKS